MKRLVLLPLLTLATACNPAGPDETVPAAQATDTQDAIPSKPVALPETGADERVSRPAEPQEVLRDWADALESRDWVAARAVWGEEGEQSGLSPKEFATAWSKYKTIEIEIGEAEIEGAAGSLYYEPTVTMSGVLQTDEPYLMEGPVRLRRSNDVPGASPQHLRWHIQSTDLRPRRVD
ncbi:MAG: hypothetical protein RIB03_16230 [Henriciella sp.]|uniref:hypothetical protein n=1 Tax=Henriciella sp. TaxID=1968823 RepID=UPI0032EBC740